MLWTRRAFVTVCLSDVGDRARLRLARCGGSAAGDLRSTFVFRWTPPASLLAAPRRRGFAVAVGLRAAFGAGSRGEKRAALTVLCPRLSSPFALRPLPSRLRGEKRAARSLRLAVAASCDVLS